MCSSDLISGATLASYTTPPTTSGDNGAQFTVVVSNTAGSVTSSVATLTVSVQRFTITVSKTGTGRGTVASSPAGINCGATCSASYNSGTTVTLTANTAVTATFADVTAPILSLPGNLITTATSLLGAIVTFNVSATDNVDPSPTVSCSPASGSLFSIGITTVTCSATDAAGNVRSGSFLVTVLGL